MKNRILLSIFALFILCSCTKKAEPKLIENQTLEYPGLPKIELRGDEPFNETEVKYFVEEYLENQPENLLRYLDKIVICGSRNYLELGQSVTSSAFADPNTMTIYVKIDVNQGTVTHELAHIFDYAFGYHRFSDSAEFDLLYKKYVNKFHFYNDKHKDYSENELIKYDEYFMEDINEFFAECINLYWNDYDYLNKESVEIIEYLEHIFESNK